MISRIILVCVIALISYVILPLIFQRMIKRRLSTMNLRLNTTPGIAGVCTSFNNGKLVIKTVTAESSTEIAIDAKNTFFYIFRKNEDIQRIAWRSICLLQNGTTLYYVKGSKGFTQNICVFYDEKSTAVLLERIKALSVPESLPNPFKPYCIASGAFLEFVLFLQFIQSPELGMASIAALVAIFGKALPYSPPGLFFTIAVHLRDNKNVGTKKTRQYKTVGFLLLTAGILLNIAVIFLIIRNIRF